MSIQIPLDSPADDQIEVTPEMVRAGSILLQDYYGEMDDPVTNQIVRHIFLAMLSARDDRPG
jgi:hypothetical protein